MNTEPIIAPVPIDVLKSELTEDRRLRFTNKSGNEVYIVTWQNAPNVCREIGRLREIAFRAAGGGTGKALDLDEFDTMEVPYKQLIVWDPDAEAIIGGYRYLLGSDVRFDEAGQPVLATSHMFHFSEQFIRDYLPYTIELGRSWVSKEYQSTRAGAKAIFALDNLWDGLGALTVVKPNVRYLFGKVTMYPSYDRVARDMILYFLRKHFPDPDGLIMPTHPLNIEADPEQLRQLFCEDDFKADYRILNREVRARGFNIPPLVNAYMGLSPTMRMFGTAINYGFGDVEETGILIAVDEILDEKRIRHIDSFAAQHPEAVDHVSTTNLTHFGVMKSIPVLVLFALNPSLMEAKTNEKMILPNEIKSEIVSEPQNAQQTPPFGWECFRKNEVIRYVSPAKGNGADYYLIFSSNKKETPNDVGYVYLLRYDATPAKKAHITPPAVMSIVYHDLGKDKEFCGAIVMEDVVDKNGEYKGYMSREIKLDDETSQKIINLISDRTQWKNGTRITFRETTSEKLQPLKVL